jgi:hypothetical protein
MIIKADTPSQVYGAPLLYAHGVRGEGIQPSLFSRLSLSPDKGKKRCSCKGLTKERKQVPPERSRKVLVQMPVCCEAGHKDAAVQTITGAGVIFAIAPGPIAKKGLQVLGKIKRSPVPRFIFPGTLPVIVYGF